MIELLKEVGRGKRGARDLSYEEAADAASRIVTGLAEPAQIGAFLMAERIKMESVDELAAFVDVLRGHAARVRLPTGIDCSGPYDGRRDAYMASFAVAFLLAGAGLPATLHGAATLPPKRGVVLHDVLLAAGIQPHRVPIDGAVRIARDTGVLYAHADIWCPPLARMRPIREQLGMRTVFNTAEKLIDYAHAPFIALGVYHNTVFERLSALLTRLAYRQAAIVQGIEGSEDLHADRPTRVLFVQDGEARLILVDPRQYGMDAAKAPAIPWTPAAQLRVTESILQGAGSGSGTGTSAEAAAPDDLAAFSNQVLLNGALRLQLAGRAESIREGIELGRRSIASGDAWQAYANWKAAWLAAATE